MTSGNAFKNGAHARLLATPTEANGDTGHERKRRKLPPSFPFPPQAAIFTRKTADVSTNLEVDHMILDYLSHQATDHILASRRSGKNKPALQHKLVMMDTFLEIFKAKHPSYKPDPELRFRLLLLKFSTLFCHRFVRSAALPSKQSLDQLRERNTLRALDWIRDSDSLPSGEHDMSLWDTELPLAPESLEHHLAHNLWAAGFKAEDETREEAFYGTSASLRLLDVLPSFMTVIAARNELNNSNISLGLMDLSARFMLQACLEQYLVHGAYGSDAVDEAFAWGYKRPEAPEEQQDEGSVDLQAYSVEDVSSETIRMFQAEDGFPEEMSDWSELKSKYIAMIADDLSGGIEDRLDRIAKEHPIAEFEKAVLQLLVQLSASLPIPVLAQLENGSLDGMSSQETRVFLRSCGLGSQWPEVPG